MTTDKAALGIEAAEYDQEKIMTKALNQRWLIVLELQKRLQDLNPGSPEAEIVEHAISLAIESQSQEQNAKFFGYDLIRNARFSLRRTKARQHRLWQKAALFTQAWAEDTNPYIALELESQLRSELSKSGKHLNQYFNDLLNGKSIAATALACGVSQRTANRRRQQVRQIVKAYLGTQGIGSALQ